MGRRQAWEAERNIFEGPRGDAGFVGNFLLSVSISLSVLGIANLDPKHPNPTLLPWIYPPPHR